MAGTIVSDTIQNGAGASTSTTNVISGCAKAWVTFNATPAIYASYNVSSVTLASTSNFTINFTTAMPNSNYSMVGITGNTPGSTSLQAVITAGNPINASSCFYSTVNAVNSANSYQYNSIVIFSS
jgi:hypothetical protein